MLDSKIVASVKEYEICCPNCNTKSKLSAWGFVQTYWYESPRGCMEGDNWWPHKDINQCLLICPRHCAANNNWNIATRIMDLPIEAEEKRWVFGLIQQISVLHEQNLNLLFDSHSVQYGLNNKIENSEERRKNLEEYLDF